MVMTPWSQLRRIIVSADFHETASFDLPISVSGLQKDPLMPHVDPPGLSLWMIGWCPHVSLASPIPIEIGFAIVMTRCARCVLEPMATQQQLVQ